MKNKATSAKEEFKRRTERLSEIICPLRRSRYEVDSEWRHFQRMLNGLKEDYEGLELNPDFQRGHVWSPDQQQRYIENVMRGVVSTGGLLVQLNCPNFEYDNEGDLPKGVQCIDGLQRITAVSRFLADEVHPFGLTLKDLENSAFSPVGMSFTFRVAMYDFKWRADLLQHYLDFNAGGTPHSPEEIDRVKQLREEALVLKLRGQTQDEGIDFSMK